MLIIPPPRFNEQNSASTPPELNTRLIIGNSAGLTADFPVMPNDRVFDPEQQRTRWRIQPKLSDRHERSQARVFDTQRLC
ncbi:hypothetical protein VRB21_18380 [Pseudomonas poae]